MPVRSADAVWTGTLQGGEGTMKMASGAYEGEYSFSSRFEEGTGTNPEELIAAAHAGCFSMALAGNLGRAGYEPEEVRTTARVHIDKGDNGFTITRIELDTKVRAADLDDSALQEQAEAAKDSCPVSQALGGVDNISVNAELVG